VHATLSARVYFSVPKILRSRRVTPPAHSATATRSVISWPLTATAESRLRMEQHFFMMIIDDAFLLPSLSFGVSTEPEMRRYSLCFIISRPCFSLQYVFLITQAHWKLFTDFNYTVIPFGIYFFGQVINSEAMQVLCFFMTLTCIMFDM